MQIFKCEECEDERVMHGFDDVTGIPCEHSECEGISRPLTTDQAPRAEVTMDCGVIEPCPHCKGKVDWCKCGDAECCRFICEGCGAETFWNEKDREYNLKMYNKRAL